MRVMVVGAGGREHAIVWKLLRSPSVDEVFAVPGGAGMEGPRVERVRMNLKDVDGIAALAKKRGAGLVVIGPEGPLAAGLADAVRGLGIPAFGPGRAAARLEASKTFAKDFMKRHGIPTAEYETFGEADAARTWIAEQPYDRALVIKADGLAAGKGVRVCSNREEALEAVAEMMERGALGEAGARVVIEERLAGEEASLMAFCDGGIALPLPVSRDHKRVFDNDEGPNTGGMGAYAPYPVPDGLYSELRVLILDRFLKGLKADGLDYRGEIYFGLMLTGTGPKVLEFNVRFGDPETQAVLPLLESDLADALVKTAEGRLCDAWLSFSLKSSVCVVLAAEGYPGPCRTGRMMMGLDAAGGVEPADAIVFHAGTDREKGRWVTSGGRVAGVTAVADTLEAAREKAYAAAEKIVFEGRFYRKDIAAKKVLS